MIVSGIVAVAENGVIGRKGDLPWHLPDDMRYFMNTTKGHHIITGRINYESIPQRFRPLRDRVNLVVTRDREYRAPGAQVSHSLEDALEKARSNGEREVFIIGGGEIFKQALDKDLLDRLYLTRVHAEVEGDVHFPDPDPQAWELKRSERHEADDKHAFPFTFQLFDRTDRLPE